MAKSSNTLRFLKHEDNTFSLSVVDADGVDIETVLSIGDGLISIYGALSPETMKNLGVKEAFAGSGIPITVIGVDSN
jgi:hypothetical protein